MTKPLLYKFKFALILLVFFCTAGRAGTLEEVATSTNTFAACKVIDVGSTYYLLQHGFVEANPIVKFTLSHGWLPLVAISVTLWWWLDKKQDEAATLAANTVTCTVAAHNLLLIP